LSRKNDVFEILVNIKKFKDDVDNILTEYGFLKSVEIDIRKNTNDILDNLFNKFHRIVTKFKDRYSGRKYIEIMDEYDVQDYLHAFLLEHFRDVRSEEYTPSYAGGSTRIDFLLKREKAVIEVKKTRLSMSDKSLGEELIIDRDHYRKHPDCYILYCFIYDPAEIIKNPESLIDDLSEKINGFETKVYIVPKKW